MHPNPTDGFSGKTALDLTRPSVPDGFQFENNEQSLRISYSQFKPIIWLSLAFGAIFLGGGIYLLSSGALGFIYITSLLLGLFFIYSSVVGIFNKETIQVTRDRLTVSYGPLPFEKSHRLDTLKLSQLYTHKMAIPTRYRDISGYTLEAILSDGSLVPLLSDPDYDKIHFLEIQIENWLGIQDTVVPGEAAPVGSRIPPSGSL